MNYIKPLIVVDLLELRNSISGGDRKHPVHKEWDYLIIEGEKSNNSYLYFYMNDDDKTPLIKQRLIDDGFSNDDKILFLICW